MKRVQVARATVESKFEPGSFQAVRLDCQQMADDELEDVELWCESKRLEVFKPSEWRHAT